MYFLDSVFYQYNEWILMCREFIIETLTLVLDRLRSRSRKKTTPQLSSTSSLPPEGVPPDGHKRIRRRDLFYTVTYTRIQETSVDPTQLFLGPRRWKWTQRNPYNGLETLEIIEVDTTPHCYGSRVSTNLQIYFIIDFEILYNERKRRMKLWVEQWRPNIVNHNISREISS